MCFTVSLTEFMAILCRWRSPYFASRILLITSVEFLLFLHFWLFSSKALDGIPSPLPGADWALVGNILSRVSQCQWLWNKTSLLSSPRVSSSHLYSFNSNAVIKLGMYVRNVQLLLFMWGKEKKETRPGAWIMDSDLSLIHISEPTRPY